MTDLDPSAHGTIAHYTDRQTFTIDLEAGQRYRLELRGLGTMDGGSLNLYVQPVSGETWLLDTANAYGDAQGVARTVFSPTHSDTYSLTVSGWLGSAPSIDYELRAVPVVADDQGDVPATATPLMVGEHVSGVLGPDGDRDAFMLDLSEAGRYVVTIEGGDIDPVQRVSAEWFGADHEWLAWNGELSFAVSAAAPGRYWLLLEAPVWDLECQGEYRVSVRPQEDDHADLPGHATSFVLGDVLHGTLDLAGDADMFSTTLEAGQTVLLRLQGEFDVQRGPGLVVRHDGEFVTSGHLLSDSTERQVHWTAREAGTYVIKLQGRAPVAAYTLLTQAAAADDHADEAVDATAWAVGDVLAAAFEHAGDVDCFALELQGGTRYRLDLRGTDGQPTGQLAVGSVDASETGSYIDGGWRAGIVTFEVAQGGRYAVTALAAGTSGAYTLQAQALPADDHADSAFSATPLSLGVPIDATLDPGHDRDCFSFAAEAGQAYRCILMALDDATWQSYELDVGDAAGSLSGISRLGATQGEAFTSEPFVAHGSGQVTLALAVDAPNGGRYRVSVELADPATAYNREATAMGALPLGKPQDDVVDLSGSAGADQLRGRDGSDVLRGGPGNDDLFPGGGHDTVRGGPGFDVVHFAGPLADFAVVPPFPESWEVIDQRADGGTDLLVGVERLVFDDATLAVDFAGHAGTVLRMSVLCAGSPGVDPYQIAEALRLLDATGRIDALADFAWNALGGPMHDASASHAWLVRLAQDHVPDLLPSESDVQHWVQTLDAGLITPQAALALACDDAATAQLVDLIGLAYWPIWLPPEGG